MVRFRFRLQRVLEYRAMQEEWAKDAYLQAKARRIKADADLDDIQTRRSEAQSVQARTVQQRRTQEDYLSRLAEEIEQQKSLIQVLSGEEAIAEQEWLEAKRNHEALAKLREAAEEEWAKQAEQEEQKGLDDWTSSRRAA